MKQVEDQIVKDERLELVGRLASSHYHFLPHGRFNSIGAEPEVFALLRAKKIPYTIHPPV